MRKKYVFDQYLCPSSEKLCPEEWFNLTHTIRATPTTGKRPKKTTKYEIFSSNLINYSKRCLDDNQQFVDIPAHIPDAPTSLDDPELGACFVEWLKQAIATGKYVINHKHSPIHLLPDNLIGILSPYVFIDFCTEYCLKSKNPNENPHVKVKNTIRKLRANIKFGKKDIRFYRFIKQPKSRLCFYLFPPTFLVSDEIMSRTRVNKKLELITKETWDKM